MAIRKRRTIKESTLSKEARISMVKKDLKACNKKIKELTSIDTYDLLYTEKLRLEREIKVEEIKRDKLKSKLSTLGYEEKRGRPVKSDSEKYDSNRSKFTAMLLTENLDYLKDLKDTKKIKNISAFLDELIENCRCWKGTS